MARRSSSTAMSADFVHRLERSTIVQPLETLDRDWFNRARDGREIGTSEGTARPPRTRSASIAVLLRRREGKVEMLFIKRAFNPRDKWSGHIALPGGRQEAGETAFQAAVRECEEEVGISLESGRFAVLGRLKDTRTSTNRDGITVACFVFFQLKTQVELPVKVQPAEVAHAWWVDTAMFFPHPSPGELGMPVSGLVKIASKPYLKVLLRLFRAETVFLPCFRLPPPPFHRTHTAVAVVPGAGEATPSSILLAAASPTENPRDPDTFVLWGLTFGIVANLTVAAGGRTFAYEKPPYFRKAQTTTVGWGRGCREPRCSKLLANVQGWAKTLAQTKMACKLKRFHSLVPDFLAYVFYRLKGWNRAIASFFNTSRLRQ